MGKILLISQEETDTWFVNGISIGVRQPKIIVGTKIKELLREMVKTEPTGNASIQKGVSEEEFIKDMGNNYTETLKRVLEDKEIPKEKLFNKIVEYFGVDKNFFYDTNLKNVLVNDSRMVVAEYETEARALEVKKEIDEMIISNYQNGKPIIIKLPKE